MSRSHAPSALAACRLALTGAALAAAPGAAATGATASAAVSGNGLPIARAVLERILAMPHAKGEIAVSYRRAGAALEARVMLPAGLTGTFAWRGSTRAPVAGEQSVRLE